MEFETGAQQHCFHCGIDVSLVWSEGPAAKPVLCCFCGSWWDSFANFDGFDILKDARNAESCEPKLHPLLNINGSTPNLGNIEEKSFFGSDLIGNDGHPFSSPFVVNAEMSPESSSGISMSESNTQKKTAEEEIPAPLSEPCYIPAKNDSTPVSSPTERLRQQLEQLHINQMGEDPESVLIFDRINKYIPENEIGLGCMLLEPDWHSKKESKADSSIGAAKAASIAPSAKDPKLKYKRKHIKNNRCS